jgi:NDP-sugar pyrophosphorylase family protein
MMVKERMFGTEYHSSLFIKAYFEEMFRTHQLNHYTRIPGVGYLNTVVVEEGKVFVRFTKKPDPRLSKLGKVTPNNVERGLGAVYPELFKNDPDLEQLDRLKAEANQKLMKCFKALIRDHRGLFIPGFGVLTKDEWVITQFDIDRLTSYYNKEQDFRDESPVNPEH